VHQGKDITGYIEDILKSLPKKVQDEIEKIKPSFGQEVEKARSRFISDDFAIKPEDVPPALAEKLIKALYDVVASGNKILTTLRAERKAIQSETQTTHCR